MKAFLASLALALFFAAGVATAGNTPSAGDDAGCSHQKKWEDT